ncbi:molybdenum ABC transporter substrate-binding protein [Halobacteriales archaeon QS_1_67_19]|nr:MAG: molybdenum ABC transporter substrate-binding protein [Halobacteriales archaeon QS_1_67_19]
MREQRTRRELLAGAGALGLAGLAGCAGGRLGVGGASDGASTTGDQSVTIFHAGSLAPPFETAESEFEAEHSASVSREAKGSVASTKKITAQDRSADVLGVSDFRLLRDRLLPDYGDWYAVFATNAMSLQYREGAPGADEIGPDNWWEILSREGVTVGHADPAIDPGGYRAVMAMQLGKEEFDGRRLYDQRTYERIRENMTVPTGTETKLAGQLQAGKLDYALYYRSIAASTGLPRVDLQPHVDLSEFTAEHARHYAKAAVETDAGTFTGAPIAYGITVPSVAEAPEAGAQWIEHMLTEPGREALTASGLIPSEPAIVTDGGEVPDRVARHAEAKSSLGPLDL